MTIEDYPKISIVTPNYNMASFLEDTLESVTSQGYPNLEYIVVDGGSTDESLDIIKRYEHHLTYWISEPDGGLYEALEKGLSRTTGEIMLWLNSDDMLQSRSLFTLAQIFTDLPEVQWVTGVQVNYDEGSRSVGLRHTNLISKFHYLSGDFFWIQQESTAWRRSLWNKAGSHINTDKKLAGDFALWMRFFRYAKLYPVNALIGGFRKRRSGQLSHDESTYRRECAELIAQEERLLNQPDHQQLERVRRFRSFRKALKALRIFNHVALRRQAEARWYDLPQEIRYDHAKKCFTLC